MDDKIFELAAVMPVMLMGAPGVGKTAAVTDFAQQIGADLLDVSLSAETPSSFEGKDYIDPQTGELRKARAWWLKRIDENKAQVCQRCSFLMSTRTRRMRYSSWLTVPSMNGSCMV